MAAQITKAVKIIFWERKHIFKYEQSINENDVQKNFIGSTLNALPTQAIMICGPRVPQQLTKVLHCLKM